MHIMIFTPKKSADRIKNESAYLIVIVALKWLTTQLQSKELYKMKTLMKLNFNKLQKLPKYKNSSIYLKVNVKTYSDKN